MIQLRRALLLLLTLTLGSVTFVAYAQSSADGADAAQLLGWVTDPVKCPVCGGYYVEPPLEGTDNASLLDSPTIITPNKSSVSYQVNGALVFSEGLSISQPGRTLFADEATIFPNPDTKKPQIIEAHGNVRLHQKGALLMGDNLKANLTSHQAQINNIHYLLKVDAASPGSSTDITADRTHINEIFTGYAHGKADDAKQLSSNEYIFNNATYSTCSPLSTTWQLSARKIELDETEGIGHAYDTLFKLKGVPLLYLPYFDFPLNKERKSGFLYGSISSNSSSGLGIAVPYYLNLAPNYDDTLTPVLFSKRGLLVQNDFRYLTPANEGDLLFGVVPYDTADHEVRYNYSFNNNLNVNNWQSNINYNYVSDDNYFNDFGSMFNVLGTNQTLLNRSGTLTYTAPSFSFNGLLQSYQVINPLLLTANRPYDQLPSLTFSADHPFLSMPLDVGITSNFTNFQKSPLADDPSSPVTGERAFMIPNISLPLSSSYGHFTPTLSVDAATYSLANTSVNGLPSSQISRSIPIFDIDSALNFERDFEWGNKDFTQTLTPRLFYLYVPYRDQNNTPVFDSSVNTFDYNALFATNRFSGEDRIGDANQLSYALESAINNATGFQVINAGVGQIWYFRNRSVSLCQNPAGTPTPCIASENPDYQQAVSDATGFLTYHFNNAWSFDSDFSYNTINHQSDYQNYAFQYLPDDDHLFNVGYSANRLDYNLLTPAEVLAGSPAPESRELNTSFVYNITPEWSLMSNLSFSVQPNNRTPISEFVGIQYNSCCYAVRFAAYRYLSDLNPNTPGVYNGPMSTTYMIQFLLKGLGTAGNNQVNDLLNSIPGYNHSMLGF